MSSVQTASKCKYYYSITKNIQLRITKIILLQSELQRRLRSELVPHLVNPLSNICDYIEDTDADTDTDVCT